MSNLSNLYISQSYYGVVNLVDSTQPFASQSQTQIQFQDGVGESLGMSVTDVKDFIFDNNVVVSQSLEVLGVISGSDARFSGDLFVSGNVHATRVITTIESSSVIYSSGSNIIGDEVSDVQTIVGQTSISGSLTVIGPHSHTGDVSITGSLFVSNEISSSTISGLGNATIYSQSVDNSINTLSQSVDTTIQTLSSSIDSRLDYLEGPFSTSVDARLDELEATSSYLDNEFSSSVDSRLDQLEADSGSQDSRLDNLEFFTASQESKDITLSAYTQSNDTKWNTLQSVTSSLNTFTQSADQRLDSLELFTASLTANFVTDAEYSSSIAVVTSSLYSYIDTQDTTLQNNINTKLDTASFDNFVNNTYTPFSSSVDSRINTNASNLTSVSASIAVTDNAQNVRIDDLASYTGSYATTGSNTFIGTEVISGSLQVSGSSSYNGSLRGNVTALTISSATASIDCSLGNFFTLTLVNGNTHLVATNIEGGETLTLQLTQPSSGYGTISWNSSIKFPLYNLPNPTNQNDSIDIITFVSFDSSSLKGVMSNKFE